MAKNEHEKSAGPTVAHALLFIFQFRLKFFSFLHQLGADGFRFFHVIGNGQLAVQSNLPLRNLRGVTRVEFRQRRLLLGGELGGWGAFIETLHRDFVGGFHAVK